MTRSIIPWSASDAIRQVFGPAADSLTSPGREVLLANLRGLAEELTPPDQELDYYDAAVELRRRISGADQLSYYVEVLLIGANRRRAALAKVGGGAQ